MAEPIPTITAEDLCTLTGLTDRRHRQLAGEGYFPPPIKGQYQQVLSIRGLFRYYREMRQRDKGDLATEQLAKVKAERMAVELDLASKQKTTVQLSDVEHIWTDSLLSVRARLLQAGSKAEMAFPTWEDARACKAWMEAEARDMMTDLSEQKNYRPKEQIEHPESSGEN